MVSSGRPWGNAGIPGIYVVLLYDVLAGMGLDAPSCLLYTSSEPTRLGMIS